MRLWKRRIVGSRGWDMPCKEGLLKCNNMEVSWAIVFWKILGEMYKTWMVWWKQRKIQWQALMGAGRCGEHECAQISWNCHQKQIARHVIALSLKQLQMILCHIQSVLFVLRSYGVQKVSSIFVIYINVNSTLFNQKDLNMSLKTYQMSINCDQQHCALPIICGTDCWC